MSALRIPLVALGVVALAGTASSVLAFQSTPGRGRPCATQSMTSTRTQSSWSLLVQRAEAKAKTQPETPSYAKKQPTRREVFQVGAAAALLVASSSPASAALPWEQNPINKRSGLTVQTAEAAGYNVGFVTYLVRFLLNFDKDIQQYWISETGNLKKSNTAEEVFGELAASVEVKLLDYRGAQGAKLLLQELLDRYCPSISETENDNSSDSNSANNLYSRRTRREIREARRQLALLFALLSSDLQPVAELTRLLGQIDNARVRRSGIRILDRSVRWDMNSNQDDNVVIFGPPAVGNARAQGTPLVARAVRVTDGGNGYTSIPLVQVNGVPLEPSAVEVVLQNGTVTEIKLLEGAVDGADQTLLQPQSSRSITLSPPSEGQGRTAQALIEQRVVGVNLTDPGAGYALEKPVKIYLGPSRYANATTEELAKQLKENRRMVLLGEATTYSDTSSYSSFRKESSTAVAGEDETIAPSGAAGSGVSAASSGTDEGLPALPFWTPQSTSATFLRLFPAGVGLEYDVNAKRYFLVVDQTIQLNNPGIGRRPLGPEFGPRGRAPVERDRQLTLDTLVRFALSGAICASGVHVALTPLDVVKTKTQTDPAKYPTVPSSFRTVLTEEGPSTFLTGWAPTLAGNFASGAAVYTLTEFIRRSLSEQAGPLALQYEVPIILTAAAFASSVGSVLSCPFEAVRIRQVAQPRFGPNAIAVFDRLVREEGWGSLVNAIPVFLVKNVPYAMTKFTIFDLFTERVYVAWPQASENLKLSLLVSLMGGCLGGTAAAVVSNPADALISELKKAKSDISAPDAAVAMWNRGKFSPFFKGLPVRLVYYSLIASLQFLVYDGVRFALGIGPDDLKLYLDVLGGALREGGGPI